MTKSPGFESAAAQSDISCNICRQTSLSKLVDFGLQPLANRFVRKPQDKHFLCQLTLGLCSTCAAAQLIESAPEEEMRPRFDWISYNEPEAHLDDVAERIRRLPGVSTNDLVIGLTEQDSSTLERLQAAGFSNMHGLRIKEDLKVTAPYAGTESTAPALIDEVESLKQQLGRPKVVVARFILEHARRVCEFLAALRRLVACDGYIVFEVPDNSRIFAHRDYSFIWEEHITYFTEFSLFRAFALNHWSVHDSKIYPYAYEDTLSAIVKPAIGSPQIDAGVAPVSYTEMQLVSAYADNFAATKRQYQASLSHWRNNKGKVALYGAGHQAASFLNLLELGDYVNVILDDRPEKQGLFMPGSTLPIRSSTFLSEGDISLCLLTMSPKGESIVINKNHEFVESGGNFLSIYSSSARALIRDEWHENSRAKQRSPVR